MLLNKEINQAIQTRLNEHTFSPGEITVLSVWSTPRLIIAKCLYLDKEVVVDFTTREGDFLADLIYDGIQNDTYYFMEDILKGFESGDVIDKILLIWPADAPVENVVSIKKPKLDMADAAKRLGSQFNVKVNKG